MVAYDELRISPNYFHIRKILKLSDLDFNSFNNSVNGCFILQLPKSNTSY